MSRSAAFAQRLLGHPAIGAVFCENRNVDVARLHPVPVGIHPADLLRNRGAQVLSEIASANGSSRHTDVFVPHAADTEPASEELEDWVAASPLACVQEQPVGPVATWRELARHRFSLPSWKTVLDSPATFEALAVSTIPILFDGPLAAAYDGLPVVRIRDLSEITSGNLDRWWRQLSPAFSDPTFLRPEFWWRRIVRSLPAHQKKRAFLVVGPESHGTHLLTDLLIRAGCRGHSGDHADWRGEVDDSPDDRQPWDDQLPTGEDPIVWRRSVPHGGRWPDLERMIFDLEGRGYGVRVLVLHRDRVAGVRSQLRWRHVLDEPTGRAQIDRAYRHIFAAITAADVPASIISYESLVSYPLARGELLDELGLVGIDPSLEIWDGNRKWHDGLGSPAEPENPAHQKDPTDRDDTAEQVDPGSSRSAPSAAGRTSAPGSEAAPFPEHWFVCNRKKWERHERTFERGRRRMARTRAVFCGLARDVEPALDAVRHRIERAGRLFADFRVVVLENDSADRTREVLERWTRDDPRVSLLGEDRGWPVWGSTRAPERMSALAEVRNEVLDHVVACHRDFDVAIVLDFDLERGFSEVGLSTTFGITDWDVMASNGLLVGDDPPHAAPLFWDEWALRMPGQTKARRGEEPSQLFFQRGEDPVAVDSAFGGLAVYRMEAFDCGARYGGEDCEHVVLHRDLRERGFGRQFLNPSQIVLYGSTEALPPSPTGEER